VTPATLLTLTSSVLVALAATAIGWAAARTLAALRAERALPPQDLGPQASLPAAPHFLGRGSVWGVPDARWRRELIILMARSWAKSGPVLLVPQADHREAFAARLAGVSGVTWLAEDGPPPDTVLDAADACRQQGPPAVLVDGPGALEPPAPDEAPDAVLAELLSERPEGLTLLALADADAPLAAPPQQVLELGDDALASRGEGPRFAIRDGHLQA